MARKSRDSQKETDTVSAHQRAPTHIAALCDLLAAGVTQHIPDTISKAGDNWCTIGKPGFGFVQHTKKSLNVFLVCKESEASELSTLLNTQTALTLLERQSLGSGWAKKTPYFLKIATPEAAEAAVPLLLFLARRPSPPPRTDAIVMPSEDGFADRWEGGRAVMFVNRYERDPKARADCLRIFGPSCAVCGFDFERQYGEIGKNFIHVHHLKPLSAIGASHKINPRSDLRPVCPNCHEMLHRRSPPFSIGELRDIRDRLKAH